MILKIKVKPHSGKQEVEKISDEEYKISLKSVPEDNKANIELIKLLSKKLKVSSKNINIIKGLTSKNKIVKIGESNDKRTQGV